jgi:F420H(2)-dependent quinone reductase
VTGAPAPLGALARRLPQVSGRLASAHAAVFCTSQGRMLSRWFGASIMVLETVGRRSGRRRAVPLVYVRDGADLVVVAANAGAPRHPAWWLNLREAGEAVAVLGPERRRVRPAEATGAERDRLWRLVAAVSPLDAYGALTARRFPVVALRPATSAPTGLLLAIIGQRAPHASEVVPRDRRYSRPLPSRPDGEGFGRPGAVSCWFRRRSAVAPAND